MTLFDYTEGRCIVAVDEADESGDKRRFMWEELNAGSQPQTGWHRVVFDAAGAFECAERVQHNEYLLRSRSTALTDGLLSIADRLPRDADVSPDRLQSDWPAAFAEVVRLSKLEIEEIYC